MDPIVFFTLSELPKELKVSGKAIKLPPVLQRQFNSLDFNIGRVNVTGDGNCGYYVIGLLQYLVNGNILGLSDLKLIRKQQASNKLVNVDNHYLEYIEVGTILDYLMPTLNVAVIVQTDIKRSGEMRKHCTYPIRIVNYKPEQNWAFLLMSHNGYHYELLTVTEMDKQRAIFLPEEAEQIIDEFPEQNVSAKDQLEFLDTEDFIYF